MSRILGALFALSLMAPIATAGSITGVTASTTMGTQANYNIAQLTNGAGLTSFTGSATHNNSYQDMWLSNAHVTGTVTFNLGGTYFLNTLYLWNFNYDIDSGVSLTRGVQNFNVEVSKDGTNYTTVLSSQSLSEGTGSSALASQSYALSSVEASYVEIVITSNWGDASYTGLSSVVFDGSAVPEPSTFVLGGLAVLAGLARFAACRRKTRIVT